MLYPRLVRDFVQSTPMNVVVDADGIDEDGAPIEGARWEGSANYQDHTHDIYAKDKVETEVLASIYIDGDPFPSLSVIAGGEVTVFDETRNIVRGMKARNPDGTVNYTRLELR